MYTYCTPHNHLRKQTHASNHLPAHPPTETHLGLSTAEVGFDVLGVEFDSSLAVGHDFAIVFAKQFYGSAIWVVDCLNICVYVYIYVCMNVNDFVVVFAKQFYGSAIWVADYLNMCVYINLYICIELNDFVVVLAQEFYGSAVRAVDYLFIELR